MFTPENLVFLSTNLDPLIRCFRKVMLVQICIFYVQRPLDRNAHVRKIVIYLYSSQSYFIYWFNGSIYLDCSSGRAEAWR